MTDSRSGNTENATAGRASVALNPLSWYHTADGYRPEEAPPLSEIYRRVREAGFTAVPVAPQAPLDLEELKKYSKMLRTTGLAPAPGYFSAAFSDPSALADSVERARLVAAQHSALGLDRIFIAGQFPDPPRVASPAQGVGSDRQRLDVLIDNLHVVAKAMVDEGVTPCLHQHVGTLIETQEEVDRVLSSIEPSLLLFGPDTGHLAWAGADPADLIRRYPGRVGAVHIKDVHFDVVKAARAAGDDYWAATGRHLWTEPGRGDIKFDAILQALNGFAGWFVIEVDVPDRVTPEESAALGWRWSQDHLL
jgi:inosose dehydratase